MLDSLLGRARLKDRVAELEEENRSLEQRLEAESDRRAAAVSDRQTAQQRVNRLEDRIAELEDRVERAGDGERALEFRDVASLRGQRRGAILGYLESLSFGPEGILTAYVEDGADLSSEIRDAFGEHSALLQRAAPCLAVTDDADLLSACLSVPVPPERFSTWDRSVRLERDWFEPTGRHAVALVRSDLFAMGEFDGDERVAFHGFDSELQRQHSKGGFSQSRFERLRDQQIQSHVERCKAAIEERSAETLYVVGEASLLGEVAPAADATQAVGATGDPEPALAAAVREFWTVRLRAM